ncbi:MAG: hypothetical protein AB1384_04260 [Actinomycetota bacterium]
MAVGAEIKRSIFTQQLAKVLEQEGITTPLYVLDLLDKPFADFTDEDKRLYETQIKQKELLILFARLLQKIYGSAGEATKHSWRGMCHLLKDSPIKVCVSYVINQEEEQEIRAEQEAETAPARAARFTTPGGEAGGGAPDASRKSYFTKKLERKLDERGIKVPVSIISLLDKPFDEFSPQEMRIYEEEFKGRQLTILFSDLLDELYEETGRVSSGWNAMCRYLKETPMKLIATYVVQEEERLEVMGEVVPEEVVGQPVREKLNVKRYQAPAAEHKESQSRRRRK